MTGTKLLRPILALLSAALGLWQPASLLAQNPPKAAAQLPAGQPQQLFAYVPQQRPALTLAADSGTHSAGQNIHFTLTWNQKVSASSYRFVWGDDRFDDTPRLYADHSYQAAGKYVVHVTTKVSVEGKVAEITSNRVIVTVTNPMPAPVLTLTADPTTPFVGQNVHFTAAWNRPVSGASYHFDWGDGESSNSQQPDANHAYAARGTYSVYVITKALVNDRDIEVQSNRVTVTVGQAAALARAPVLTLTANPETLVVAQNVHFTASWNQSVFASTYHFDWGDGESSDTSQPSADHSYAEPGIHIVSVFAEALVNGKSFKVQSNRVTVTVGQAAASAPAPVLTLAADSATPLVGQNVHFTASWNQSVFASTYHFDWGDGQSSDSQQPYADHSYATLASYTVSVTASALVNDRQIGIPSNQVVVSVTQSPPIVVSPVVTVRLLTEKPVAGKNVAVEASLHPPRTVRDYQFDWGDGRHSVVSGVKGSARANHAYAATGRYTVQVAALVGGTDTSPPTGSLPIVVQEAPMAAVWLVLVAIGVLIAPG